MIGQHIYMRCLVGHYQSGNSINPGSRTAAVSDGLFNSNETTNLIESRCSLDEAFAGRENVFGYDKSVLKIFFPKKRQLVAARIWRVNDQLTNDKRICTYAFSHVVTGDDLQTLVDDPGALFDAARYESYPSCSRRVLAAGDHRLTIDPSFNQLQPRSSPPSFALFRQCGFTEETFRQYIYGIFQALSKDTPFAVLLPRSVRDAWKEDRDPMEQLLYATYLLLPRFVRIHLSSVSHWGCDLSQKTVEGIRLFFVHPRAQENNPQTDSQDDLQKLMSGSILFLDVAGGTSVNIDCPQSKGYVDFLCGVMSGRFPSTAPDAMDAAFRNLIGDLYWKSKPVLEICEMLYLIRHAEEEKSRESYQAAIMGSAEALARHAPEHPALDDFYAQAIDALYEDAASNPPALDPYFLQLLRGPEQPLKGYGKLYSLLLIRVLSNEDCSEELPKYLCEELGRQQQAREQIQVFFNGLANSTWTVDQIFPLLLQLVLAVLQFCEENPYPQIGDPAARVKEEMSRILLENKAWDKMKPIARFVSKQLSAQGLSESAYQNACDTLFRLLFRTSGEIKEAVASYVGDEENRLIQQSAPHRNTQFANSFARNLRQYVREGGAFGWDEMKLLIRLSCRKQFVGTGALLPLFEELCEKWPWKDQNPCDDPALLSAVFHGGDQAYAVRQLTVLAERALALLPFGRLKQDFWAALIRVSSLENRPAVFSLLCAYMAKDAVSGELPALMELLRQENLLIPFYVYAIAQTERIRDAAANAIGKKTGAVRRALLESTQGMSSNDSKSDRVRASYRAWLQEELQEKETTMAKWRLLEEESKMIDAVSQNVRPTLANAFHTEVKSLARELLETCIPDECGALSSNDAAALDQILSDTFSDLDVRSGRRGCVKLMIKVDEIIRSCQASGQEELFFELDQLILDNRQRLQQTVITKRLDRALAVANASGNSQAALTEEVQTVFALQLFRMAANEKAFQLSDFTKRCKVPPDLPPRDKAALYLRLLRGSQYVDGGRLRSYGRTVYEAVLPELEALAGSCPRESFGSREDPGTIDEALWARLVSAVSRQDRDRLLKILEDGGVFRSGHKNHEVREVTGGSRASLGTSDILIALLCLLTCIVLCVGFYKLVEAFSRINQVTAAVVIWALNGILIAVALLLGLSIMKGDRKK